MKQIYSIISTLLLVSGFCCCYFTSGLRAQVFQAPNVIITPESLQEKANALKGLHETLENVNSQVVTTEWITSTYAEAENPPMAGYPAAPGNPVPDDYNFSLAKKIIAFLRDDAIHPELESVTLLGDALLIPASYYFYTPNLNASSSWIPSDLFYLSPDYDFQPEYAVGRIPVNDPEEAQNYLDKVERWKSALSPDWFYNIELFAGDPYDDGILQAEVGVLEMVNKGYLSGTNVHKNFYSRGKDHTDTLLARLAADNTGIFYCSGHGSGTSFAHNVGSTTVSDIQALPQANNPSVFINPSCLNGGFDYEYMPVASGPEGFGEALIRAQGGSVAYFGSTRVGHARNTHSLMPNGQMIMNDAVHLKRMTNYLIKAWAEGYNTFGGMRKKALEDYMTLFTPVDRLDSITVMEFVLLGDPVFSMLPKPTGVLPGIATLQVTPEAASPAQGLTPPVHQFTQQYNPNLMIEAQTTASGMHVFACTLNLNSPVNAQPHSDTVLNTPPFRFPFNPNNTSTMMLAWEDDSQQEVRLYLSFEEVENFFPDVPTLYPIDTLPTPGSFHVCWSPSSDIDDGIATYYLREMTTPTEILDSCNSFSCWSNDGFRLEDQGWNGSGCFYSGSGNLINRSITTLMPVEVEADDTLKMVVRYNIEEGWDFAFLEISINGIQFNPLTSFTGFQANWLPVEIPLKNWAGSKVYFRLRYETDDFVTNPGIWIDNIEPIGWFDEITFPGPVTDTLLPVQNHYNNTFYYCVKAVDSAGYESGWSNIQSVTIKSKPQAVEDLMTDQPSARGWYQNGSETIILETTKPVDPNTRVTLYNLSGQCLVSHGWGSIQTSCTSAAIPAWKIPSGIYLIRLQTPRVTTLKILKPE